MGFGYNYGMMGSFGLFGSLTWLLAILFLILGCVYFWKEINRKK